MVNPTETEVNGTLEDMMVESVGDGTDSSGSYAVDGQVVQNSEWGGQAREVVRNEETDVKI